MSGLRDRRTYIGGVRGVGHSFNGFAWFSMDCQKTFLSSYPKVPKEAELGIFFILTW